MAVIATRGGDLEAAVTTDEPFMDRASVTFSVPVTHPRVADGSLNAWSPLRVTVTDGGGSVVIPAWVVEPSGGGDVVEIRAADAAIWLERQSRTKPTATGTEEIVRELLATGWSSLEQRKPERAAIDDGPGGRWGGNIGKLISGSGSGWGYAGDPGDAALGWAATSPSGPSGELDLDWSTWATPGGTVSRLRLHVVHHTAYTGAATRETTDWSARRVVDWSANPSWTNRLAVSADDGGSYGPAHVLPDPGRGSRHDVVDVSGERSWALGDLATLRVALTIAASATTHAWAWAVDAVWLELDAGDAPPPFPLLPGVIGPNLGTVSLQAGRKTLRGWLDDVCAQAHAEWRVRALPAPLGWAALDVLPTVGGRLAGSVTWGGVTRAIGALEEGGLVSSATASVAGLDYANRVTVTNDQGEAMADDAPAQRQVGVHEVLVDGPSGAAVATLARQASEELARRAHGQRTFALVLPATPGLWSAIGLGDTARVRVQRAPFVPWEGTARVLARQIDDAAGTLTLSVGSVSQTSPAAAADAVPVAGDADLAAVRETAGRRKRRAFAAALGSYWRAAQWSS